MGGLTADAAKLSIQDRQASGIRGGHVSGSSERAAAKNGSASACVGMFCSGRQDRLCISVSMRAADHFDRLYRQTERYWWRDKDRYATNPDAYPYSLLTQHTLRLLSDQPPGRALDLGAGEGADSIRLALLGYQADAVEVSEVAAAKIGRFARDAGVQIGVTVADIPLYARP